MMKYGFSTNKDRKEKKLIKICHNGSKMRDSYISVHKTKHKKFIFTDPETIKTVNLKSVPLHLIVLNTVYRNR